MTPEFWGALLNDNGDFSLNKCCIKPSSITTIGEKVKSPGGEGVVVVKSGEIEQRNSLLS
ncbi:hypothetical protein [Moorena sp. SIO3A2]|uniref:hypothetical protein n=1 Tax=Moorena sp. SIO3A2 TaxID=2607841 RepID=UPI0013BE08D2|nr:hypothetical protein [Moorena sp. SIO3A2]NER91541.1 hypothetical protein [Moorena sp. SIO3A2]